MNVLHITNYDIKGGAEVVFSITAANPETNNFTAYCPSGKDSKKPDVVFNTWESDSKLIGFFNYVFSFHNYNELKKFLLNESISVIHIQGFFSSISPSILLAIKSAKKLKAIKVVQTLHEFHLICPNASLYNFNKNQICEKCIGRNLKYNIFIENCDKRGLFHSAIKGIRSFVSNNLLDHKNVVDRFICPSEFLKSKLLEDSVSENKLTLIRNPIEHFANESELQKQNIICYFGRFSYEKDIPFLINTFDKWKTKQPSDFKLLLIGDGEEKEKVLELVQQSKFRNEIMIKNFLAKKELINEINICKYFALTSSCYENSPLSIIEAVSLGIIPIVPAIGGMKESIESLTHVGKTYQPNDSESWINAINSLEMNYKKESVLVNSAMLQIKKELNLKKYWGELNKLYSDLIN